MRLRLIVLFLKQYGKMIMMSIAVGYILVKLFPRKDKIAKTAEAKDNLISRSFQDRQIKDVDEAQITAHLNQVTYLRRSELFLKRRQVLLDVCNMSESLYVGVNPEAILRNHFIVDRKHKFVYCAMEKTGSTFWRRLFQIISGASMEKNPLDIPAADALGGNVETFRSLSFDDIHSLLTSSKTFIIVRDPYVRLYSGYIDKLFSANKVFWDGIGKYAIRKFRYKPSKLSLMCGHDLTFPEFVKYFIYSETFRTHRDGHFIPMFDHCRPCQVKYDLVAKMDTLEEDTLSILDMLNMTGLRKQLAKQFILGTSDDSFIDQTDILFKSFKNTDKCLSMYENQKRMWTKFQIRGLISKTALFPFEKDVSVHLSKERYIDALKQVAIDTKNQKDSSSLRYEFMSQAYAEVQKKDIVALHKILNKDCVLFGYDCQSHPWVKNAIMR